MHVRQYVRAQNRMFTWCLGKKP